MEVNLIFTACKVNSQAHFHTEAGWVCPTCGWGSRSADRVLRIKAAAADTAWHNTSCITFCLWTHQGILVSTCAASRQHSRKRAYHKAHFPSVSMQSLRKVWWCWSHHFLWIASFRCKAACFLFDLLWLYLPHHRCHVSISAWQSAQANILLMTQKLLVLLPTRSDVDIVTSGLILDTVSIFILRKPGRE